MPMIELAHPTEALVDRIIRSNAAVLAREPDVRALQDFRQKFAPKALFYQANLLGGTIRLLMAQGAAEELGVAPLSSHVLDHLHTQYAEDEGPALDQYECSAIAAGLTYLYALPAGEGELSDAEVAHLRLGSSRLHLITSRLGERSTAIALSMYHQEQRAV